MAASRRTSAESGNPSGLQAVNNGSLAGSRVVDRRDVLRIGGITVAASCLPGLALAEQAPSGPGRASAIIYLWMAGGVTHIDSFDPKPTAPVEVRGTLTDIATTMPGVRFCETMPRMASIADELALVRNYSHDSNDHLLSQVYTLSGRKVDRTGLFSEPNIGSMISAIQGPRNGLPAYLAVPGITRPGPPPHNLFVPGWLGSHHAPYALGGHPSEPDFTATRKLDNPPAEVDEPLTPRSLSLTPEMADGRLQRRAALREQLDRKLRSLEKQAALATTDSKFANALRLLQTPNIRQAFDITQESAAVREQYGRTKLGGRCLMARRLVEAGARFVMVDYGYDPDYGNIWDNHNAPSQNHPPIQEMCKRGYHLAGMDRAFAGLITDLGQRGLLESTLVVFLTEFGRTPTINARGGRDHWGAAGSLFFTGGGVRTGQVIGATDERGAKPVVSGYGPADVAASIYAALGIDHTQMVSDILNRPRPILDHGRPIPELFD